MTEAVLTGKRGAGYWMTLNRPERRNAINEALLNGVSAGLDAAVADPEVRAIVLTGAGDQAFCAGGDLAPGGGFNFDFSHPRTAYGDLLRKARDCPKPIIVAVNGACVAGGMGFLSIADIALSVRGAMFGLPEVKVGLFPMQVAALMKDLVADRVLREWALTGRLFDAAEAIDNNIINALCDDVEALNERASSLVSQLAVNSPSALRRGKYALRAMAHMSFDEAISFAESQLGLMTLTEDAQEGLAAFNQKRKPVFTGK